MELLTHAELQKFEFQPMPNLIKIHIMGLQLSYHLQIQQLFCKKLPNVKVMLSDGYPWEQLTLEEKLRFNKKDYIDEIAIPDDY